MTLRAVVFDLWGTLMAEQRDLFPERARIRFELLEPLFARHGIVTTLEDMGPRQRAANTALGLLHDEGIDVSAAERMRRILQEFDAEVAARATEAELMAFSDAYGEAFRQTPPMLLEGAVEAIEHARAEGLGVGLISNTGVASGAHLRRVLADCGLIGHFDSLLFSDEHRMAKPNPKLFEQSLADLAVTASEVAFIGDTPRFDVSPPRTYGWWVVQVGDRDDGVPPAHRRVPHAGHVMEALREMGLLGTVDAR
jgi:HAD superfamily hydrolase (TIGR01509 family)